MWDMCSTWYRKTKTPAPAQWQLLTFFYSLVCCVDFAGLHFDKYLCDEKLFGMKKMNIFSRSLWQFVVLDIRENIKDKKQW